MVQACLNSKNKNKINKVKHNVPILTNKSIKCPEIKNNEESLECPICYEKIKNNNYIVTKCDHTFCNDCLFKSLTNSSCCPLCRNELFTFEKIKPLTLSNVHYLEERSTMTRRSFNTKIVNDVISMIHHCLECNECSCTNDETREVLNTYFRCNSFQNKLARLLFAYLNNSIKVFSIYCYENLYNWLKNDTN